MQELKSGKRHCRVWLVAWAVGVWRGVNKREARLVGKERNKTNEKQKDEGEKNPKTGTRQQKIRKKPKRKRKSSPSTEECGNRNQPEGGRQDRRKSGCAASCDLAPCRCLSVDCVCGCALRVPSSCVVLLIM